MCKGGKRNSFLVGIRNGAWSLWNSNATGSYNYLSIPMAKQCYCSNNIFCWKDFLEIVTNLPRDLLRQGRACVVNSEGIWWRGSSLKLAKRGWVCWDIVNKTSYLLDVYKDGSCSCRASHPQMSQNAFKAPWNTEQNRTIAMHFFSITLRCLLCQWFPTSFVWHIPQPFWTQVSLHQHHRSCPNFHFILHWMLFNTVNYTKVDIVYGFWLLAILTVKSLLFANYLDISAFLLISN